MKTIKPLPEGVRHSMRSGIIMFDMARVVEELVFNSLDAGATKVSIFLGVVTCSLKVVDDGSGVSRDDLVLLGERYATSKFHDFSDEERASESFGFRGEALASISDISLLEITTKATGRPNGYRKVMKGSKCLHLGIDDGRRDSGTTVTVRDLFYNQPVRQKYLKSSPKKVLDSVTKCVFRIALVHSNVSFSVLDVESDAKLIQINPSSSAFSLLMRDAGTEASNSLSRVNVTDGVLNVSGYISGPGDSFKALQYICILISASSYVHLLSSAVQVSFECKKDDWRPTDGLKAGIRNRLQSNPGYILCITCPRHLYDFSFEPSKTNVEFKNWEPVLGFIERIVLANWKKDTSLELFDGGADLLAKGDRHDVLDDMIRLQKDWPEAMEPTRKKLKRSDDQAPCSDIKKDGDYFSQGKDEGSESVMPMILNDKQSSSLIRVLETRETREGGSYCDVFSDTLGVHGMATTPNCSLESSWQDTDWFTPHRSSDRGSVGIGEDFNISPIDTAEFCSYGNNFFRTKCFSSVNVGNSDADSLFLSSEWSPMFSMPPSATNWESNKQTGSLRLERMPDPDHFSAASNIKFDHEVTPQMHCREICTDSFTDIQNCSQPDGIKCKSSWGHADNVAIEEDSVRKDKFSYRDGTQKNFGKQMSRRSHSAPPFHREKKRFVSLSCRSDTKLKKSDPSEFDDLECLTQPCDASHMHTKGKILDDVSYDHIKETEKRLTSGSDLKASAGNRTVNMETQGEGGDEDFSSEESLDPIKSTTKWRHNCSVSQVAKDSHELHDQDCVLDICSGLLHIRSDESLVPGSINRHSLEHAKVLQQVDKKYIPIVACGTVAIVDQHAADERIRLEELHKKVLAGEARTITYLSADQELVLPEMGYQLLQSYSEQIKNWGWLCNINVEGSTSFKKNMSIIQRKPTPVTLNAVPCILGVNLSDVDLLEFLQQLADTDGSSTIPPSVLRVLNSKACRGAIMFGDSLLPSECSLIIDGLKQTSLCFQCAHGRPTTVPLVNLKALHKQIAKLGSRQVWHGFQRREITLVRAKSRLDEAKS
ncbi:unnamed protein product [Microthlaspi erraticum]|uniref:MutL C-terminal dimerisation domain-containing protein n=1 Tax=Microthlaspi erraticum TaxID=1685480 RepID=A0A6D2IYI1_9BRAS|nr:unnamed protein product [Microthlaspi erraticum]